MKTSEMTYREAMTKLTEIVNRLRDSENVDVDELVTDVGRAKELIRFCDGKIKRADAAIKGIVSELQTDDEAVTVPAKCDEAPDEDVADIPF
jgi:exodeoxyribonuclease VII small subunit